MEYEYAFEMATSSIRYGPGVTREVGMDLSQLKVQRVMVVTDPNLAKLAPVATVRESLERENIQYELFDRVHVEPTDLSISEAITFAREGGFGTIDIAYRTEPGTAKRYGKVVVGEAALLHENGRIEVVRRFGYGDYESRLS